jgi:hypothetical protein
MIVEKQMECRLARETEVLGENLPQRHFCPSQNPTWPDQDLNPGRRGGKPATNRLSYGAAHGSVIADGPPQILRSDSRGTRDHILLSQIRDSPNLLGQVPVFISLQKRVAQLYPQALGSLFVSCYD